MHTIFCDRIFHQFPIAVQIQHCLHTCDTTYSLNFITHRFRFLSTNHTISDSASYTIWSSVIRPMHKLLISTSASGGISARTSLSPSTVRFFILHFQFTSHYEVIVCYIVFYISLVCLTQQAKKYVMLVPKLGILMSQALSLTVVFEIIETKRLLYFLFRHNNL